MPYSFVLWSNNWSWDSNRDDILDLDTETKTPVNEKSAKKNFFAVRDQIIKAVKANTFPEGINFDKVIKGLNQ